METYERKVGGGSGCRNKGLRNKVGVAKWMSEGRGGRGGEVEDGLVEGASSGAETRGVRWRSWERKEKQGGKVE